MAGVHFLHNVSLFANFTTEELEPLAGMLVARRYREGEEIFAQNSLGKSLFIVKTGRVAIVVTDSTGNTITVAEFGSGQVFGEFGLLDGLPRSAGAVARERTEILLLSRSDFFMYLEQRPAVAINLVVLLSRRLRFTLQRTEDEVEPASPLARLAGLLVDFGERYGTPDDGDIQLPIRLTQGEIAGMMGCPRSEAEAALATLRTKGLLTVHGLQMTIHDLDALRALASAN